MKKYEYLLALDLALGCSGYTIFKVNTEKRDATVVELGSIDTHKIKERSGKLTLIASVLIGLKGRYVIKEVAIEQAFSKHNKSTAAIYSVVGVVQYVLHGLNQFTYPPTSVKLEVTGAGNASKGDVAKSVLKLFPKLVFKNEDESDSVGVGICHLRKQGLMK